MAFPKSIPTSLVVRDVARDGTNLWDLKPFQFGIFDEDTHTSLTDAEVQKRRRVYFGAGSPNQKQFTQGSKPERLFNSNNADLTFRSEVFPTRNVDRIRYQEPTKTELPNVYYLGYNGVSNVCETLKFECGKTYMFHVEVKGRPVRNIFPGEMREIIPFTTDCCDDCGQTGCDVGEDCGKYIDQLVDEFNNSLWVSRFFTASKVITCATTPETLTTTTFYKWTLTVCDNGDELALSKVQLQYPTSTVTKVSRNAPYTTYQVITTTNNAPDDFSQINLVFVDECGNCPSGYTAIPAGEAYLVSVDPVIWGDQFVTTNADTMEALLVLNAGDIDNDGSITLVSSEGKEMVFYVVIGNGTQPDPVGLVNFGVSITALGTVPASCSSDEVLTPWLSAGTCYKVQRDLCVTVGADNCDDTEQAYLDLLAEGQAIYNDLDEVVADSFELSAASASGDCVLQFTVSQYNTEYLEDDCDTSPNPVFRELTPFHGNRWIVCPCEGWTVNEDTGCPVPPAADTNCCQCGIKFTTLPTNVLLDNFSGYDFATYLEKEPVQLVVSVYRDDEGTRVCDYNTPTWLHAQRATFRQLRGDDVIKRIITERFYNQEPWVNQVNKENILFLEREGIKLGVNIKDFYYAISIYFTEEKVQNGSASANNFNNCVTLFVNENDAATVIPALRAKLATAFPDCKLENWI